MDFCPHNGRCVGRSTKDGPRLPGAAFLDRFSGPRRGFATAVNFRVGESLLPGAGQYQASTGALRPPHPILALVARTKVSLSGPLRAPLSPWNGQRDGIHDLPPIVVPLPVRALEPWPEGEAERSPEAMVQIHWPSARRASRNPPSMLSPMSTREYGSHGRNHLRHTRTSGSLSDCGFK